MNRPSPHSPKLSVILPTDTYETIVPVLEEVRRQTIAAEIEVLLVTPAVEKLKKDATAEDGFAALRFLETRTLAPLAVPRAIGIRAASAPLIFIGETHSYLAADAAEKLVGRISAGPWSVVTPGFENANPVGLLSWGSFLSAYGRWSARLPAGEIPEAPLYDALYRREIYAELDDRLEEMLAHGDNMRRHLQARGYRVYLEPAAHIAHLNIAKPGAWFHEHFLIGLTIGTRRARPWPWWRRILYAGGVWLIPFVLLKRLWPGLRIILRAQRLPLATLPTIALLFAIKALGELIGYLGGSYSAAQEKKMNHYEVRRVDYVA